MSSTGLTVCLSTHILVSHKCIDLCSTRTVEYYKFETSKALLYRVNGGTVSSKSNETSFQMLYTL